MILRSWCALVLMSCCLLLVPDVHAKGPKNVVYVMFENRAFDHMVGYLKQLNPEIDGLVGTEYNSANCSDKNSAKILVDDKAPYVDPDPSHSIPSTTQQIFCDASDPTTPGMNGFATNAESLGIAGQHVMSCFNHTSVPIISTLAMEFALFDHWFASVPGPTFPNRLFSMSATSDGYGENDIVRTAEGFPQRSIFKQLNDSGISWNAYGVEIASALMFQDMRSLDALEHMHLYEDFIQDAKEGKLAQFSFIDPSYFSVLGIPATDQHPSHSVLDGEGLMREIYEAVRNGPQWNDTLLIITYDEHGGFHDHYPTPLKGIPNPDDKNSTKPAFAFDRLGVRVPTILISPWIKKGLVVHEPPASEMPTPTSHYDHTSTIASLKKLWNLPSHLTKRDAWAATFNHVFEELAEPRTDCPTQLPSLPPQRADPLAPPVGSLPVSDLQKEFLNLAAGLHGVVDDGEGFDSEEQAGLYARGLFKSFIQGAAPPTDPRSARS